MNVQPFVDQSFYQRRVGMRVNSRHCLARNLAGVIMADSLPIAVNLVDGSRLAATNATSPTFRTTSFGKSWVFQGASLEARIQYSGTLVSQTAQNGSILALVVPTATPASVRQIVNDGVGLLTLTTAATGVFTVTGSVGRTVAQAGVPYVLVATAGSTTGTNELALYVNGALEVFATSGFALTLTWPGAWTIGATSLNNSEFNGAIAMAAVWMGRILTAADAKMLALNPYCFLM